MTIRLSDFDEPLEPVELRSGRVVAVCPIDGGVASLKREFEASEDPEILWQIVARLIPDATEEEVKQITVAQGKALMAIASGNAEALLAQLAAEAAEGNRTAPPRSKPRGQRRRTGSAS